MASRRPRHVPSAGRSGPRPAAPPWRLSKILHASRPSRFHRRGAYIGVMSSPASDRSQSVPSLLPVKEAGDRSHRIGDFWQWLGIGGDPFGTNGTLRRTFIVSLAMAAV